MKNSKIKLLGASVAASSLMMASFTQAAFTVSIAATGSSGGFTYYNIAAVNNGNTLGNNTGTALDLIDSTITTLGTGTTGAIQVNLTDLDGDGSPDANVIGFSPDTATNTLGTYERFGSTSTFSVAFVGASSTQVPSSTASNYTTDPNGTGSPTQSIAAPFSSGTVHSLEVAGTGNSPDTTALVFSHVVVPTGTTGTVSGQLGGNIGSVYNFSIAFPAVSATHSIISLTAGTTPPSSYGGPDGSIALTGKGNGSYNVSPATGFTSATTGYVSVTGFNPSTDTEIYALKLNNSGGAISPTNTTLLTAIASDINGGNLNSASVGVTASLVTGVFTSLFPGYDILLTSTTSPAATGGAAELGFDFSTGGGEQNPADTGIYVAGVAAVPEPATAAGIILGAAGLLLGRRKKHLAAAV